MPLTNAQRQAKHRAKFVKVSAEAMNTVHCALIGAQLDAAAACNHSRVACIRQAQAALYEAEGNIAQTLTSRALAMYSLAEAAEQAGDVMEHDYCMRRARALNEQARQAAGQES